MARETGGTERRDRGGGKELRKRVRHGKTGGRKEKRRKVSRAGAITQISRIWRPRALAQTAILISTSKTHTPLTSHCTYTLSFSPQTDGEGNEQSRTALPCCPISPQLYSQSIKLRTDGHLLPRSAPTKGSPGTVTLFLSLRLHSARISIYPSIKLSSFPVGGIIFCPPGWEGFEGSSVK